MILQTPSDLVCDGTQQQIATDASKGKFAVLLADTDNSGSIRVGDVNTSGSRGFPLLPGASLTLPLKSDFNELYPNDKIYFFGASSDVLYVVYGVEGN